MAGLGVEAFGGGCVEANPVGVERDGGGRRGVDGPRLRRSTSSTKMWDIPWGTGRAALEGAIGRSDNPTKERRMFTQKLVAV